MASFNDVINKAVSKKITICVKFVETGSTINCELFYTDNIYFRVNSIEVFH